jgi:hypothetical protein
MQALRTLAAATLLLGAIAPDVAAGGRNPGSLLLYPVHRSGSGFFTIVCVTNTNTQPQNPVSFGGSTGVHFDYFNVTPNPANAFQPLNCTDFDRHEFLTPADTLCVLTTCHNAVTAQGQEGYVVIKAENPSLFSSPWVFNFLVGSEIVINASGAIYSLNAIPFFGIGDGLGSPTDVNRNGRADFDNVEYQAVPETLIVDSYVALVESQLAIVNLTGGPRDLNTLFFSIWNDNEFPLSATVVFNCWFDQPLKNVSPAFDENFLRGLAANDPNELDITCDGVGDLETGWALIDSIGVQLGQSGITFSADGAIVGSITAGGESLLGAGHLLWESLATQTNGSVGP